MIDDKKLREFVAELMKYFGTDGGVELAVWEFTDIAEKYGLIRFEEYDEKTHGEMDAEPGDEIWFSNL